MNKRRKTLLVEATVVLSVTLIAVVGMICLKDWINRREALLAMQQLGEKILEYRQTQGSLPPEDTVRVLLDTVSGHVRLGRLTYRGPWITPDSPDNTILAYTQQTYHSFIVPNGYTVLYLNGQVEWLNTEEFDISE